MACSRPTGTKQTRSPPEFVERLCRGHRKESATVSRGIEHDAVDTTEMPSGLMTILRADRFRDRTR